MRLSTGQRRGQLFARKSIEAIQQETKAGALRRTLGPLQLMLLGVGCIVGAGVYVLTGTAAAHFAGPGVVVSFAIAGFACALTGLCYAELASAIPVAGSSYTYCYAALGEVFAWILGWLLVLEYGLACSTLAVGFSGYLSSLSQGFGVTIPAAITNPTIRVSATAGAWIVSRRMNLIAVVAIGVTNAVLVRGVAESARVNNVLVAIKTAVLATFVIVGIGAVVPHNWHPLIPVNEGGFTYGWQGVLRGASVLFFAYFGFEAVSTAGSEARDPQHDMPFAILGSLAVASVIYMAVALVLTGIVPFKELGVPDPIAVATDRIHHAWMAAAIKFGALTAISSVLLVMAYAQSRMAYSMACDGLLPPLFVRVHRRFRTPYGGILALGAISAVLAAVFPLSILADLVSLGTGLAFSLVCSSLIWLRNSRPDLYRPFKVPLGGIRIRGVWFGIVPVAAIVMCWLMILPVAIDIVRHAVQGNSGSAWFLGGYGVAGAMLYALYGRRHSRLARAAALSE